MEKYTIPRGLKVRETVAYGLNGKQMLYLGIGLGVSATIFPLAIPLELKIVGMVASSAGAVALSMAKVNHQDFDKYVLNSMIYPLRRKEWCEDVQTEKGVIRVRFNAEQLGAT